MANPKGIADFYDATAKAWADEWYTNESMLPLLRAFIAALPAIPRVLDLGCGAGYESMRLARLGARVTGVDISEQSLSIAREKNPDIPFFRMDMRSLDASLGLFDGIIALGSMIHVVDADLETVFAQIAARLSPNGQCWTAFVEGDGKSEARSITEIDGVPYDRQFYLHRRAVMDRTAERAGLTPLGERTLSQDDATHGWLCLAYRKDT